MVRIAVINVPKVKTAKKIFIIWLKSILIIIAY